MLVFIKRVVSKRFEWCWEREKVSCKKVVQKGACLDCGLGPVREHSNSWLRSWSERSCTERISTTDLEWWSGAAHNAFWRSRLSVAPRFWKNRIGLKLQILPPLSTKTEPVCSICLCLLSLSIENRLRTEPDHEKGMTQTNQQRTNARPLAHTAG
jgi:hypothetical protein